MSKSLLVALPLLLLGIGCQVVAVAAASVVVTEEFQKNALVATVPENTDLVWKSAKATLAHMTTDLVHTDEDVRAATTRIDDAIVTIHVSTFDVNNTTIKIAAKKDLLYSQEIAEMVQRRVIKDLER